MRILDWIKTFFSSALKRFKELFDAAFPLATQIVIGELKEIAVVAVTEIAASDISNEEKRKQAFERILKYAKANGIEARDSIVNMVIEMAVQKVKS